MVQKIYSLLESLENDTQSRDLFSTLLNNHMRDRQMLRKDVNEGEVLLINRIENEDDNYYSLHLENGSITLCQKKSEIRFLTEVYPDYTFDEMHSNLELVKKLVENNHNAVVLRLDQGKPIASIKAAWPQYMHRLCMEQLKKNDKAFLAKITSRNKGGYFAEISTFPVFIPGSLAAANKITNFDDLLGKTIPVMIENYLADSGIFIASNKKYINHILPGLINDFDFEKQYEGTVTGRSNFGIFIEFNDIFTGMLHISEMKPELFEKFQQDSHPDLALGRKMNFYVKNVDNKNRFILTERTPDESKEEEKEKKEMYTRFQEQHLNQVLTGSIIYVNPSGHNALIEFEFESKKIVGFINDSEIRKFPRGLISKGKQVRVKISDIQLEEYKVFVKRA